MHGGRSGQEEVCTHPKADEGQTDGRGNMADGLSDGHGGTTDEDQSMIIGIQCLGDTLDTETTHSYW